MKSIKTLLAAAIMIITSAILAGCFGSDAEIGTERIEAIQNYKKTVELSLEQVVSDGNIVVNIVLDNPENKFITSVEAWFSYNPELLKGVLINAEASPFEIMAPYENGFDEKLGLVKIGRGNETPVMDSSIVVAQIEFEKTGEGAAMIDAYDYRSDLSGHVSVNTMIDGEPYNIVLKPESPLIIITD